MSFNLIQHKNGVQVPIRISILDAFRSTPPKKAKSQAMANKIESASAANKQSNTTKDDGKKDDKKPDSNTTVGESSSNKPSETYTEADDIKLVAAKAVNPARSWKEIMTELGKASKTQMIERYKKIAPTTDDDKKEWADKFAKLEKSGKAKARDDGKGKGKQDAGKAKKSGGGDNKSNEQKGKDNGGQGADANNRSGGGKKKSKPNPPNSPQSASFLKQSKPAPKDDNNNNDLQLSRSLSAFSASYDRDKWLAVASRHYDLTGQRISAERAKALSEKK